MNYHRLWYVQQEAPGPKLTTAGSTHSICFDNSSSQGKQDLLWHHRISLPDQLLELVWSKAAAVPPALESRGPAHTWTLLIQFRTAVKEHSAVMSYITRIPSAFRKYCLVMLRNLSPNETKGTLRTIAVTKARMGLSVF